LVDEVGRAGTALIIAKNGKPVAELVPHRPRQQNVRGILKNEFFIAGDIISPIAAVMRAVGG